MPHRATQKPSMHSGFYLIALAFLVLGMTQSFVYAVLPVTVRELGLLEVEAGMIFSASALFWIVCSPFWGRLSDERGRRHIIALGLLGAAGSQFAFAVVLEWGHAFGVSILMLLILARCANGILGSATRPAALGYLADRTTAVQRTARVARVESGFTVGTMVGPVVGGAVLMWGLAAPFATFSLLLLLAGILCVLFLDDTPVTKAHKQRVKLRASGSNRVHAEWLSPLDIRIRRQLALGAISSTVHSTLLVGLGFYMEDVLTAPNAALYTGFGLGASSVASVICQWMVVPRYGQTPYLLVPFGATLIALALILLVFANSWQVAFPALCLYGCGHGMFRSGNVAMLFLSVRAREQGTVAGLLGMVMPIGFLTPIVSMPLYMVMPQLPYMICSIILIGVVIVTFFNPYFQRTPWQLKRPEPAGKT
ncbi:MAG: MFS transporter [Gammaproteobacteria bacterium]